jgi:hypothetical protein
MRWPVALSLGAALTLTLSGCRSSCSRVEAELRARESDVHTLSERLDQAEFHNEALMRELCAVRGLPGPHGVIEKPTEPYPVRSIVLGRQTGGQASETLPGDDALRVLVEPRDPEGSAIKAPGTLVIEALEVTREGLKHPLSLWQIPPQELRNKWQSGLITTGYSLTLPWQAWPSADKVRVIARFQMLDGRMFEADKDVSIRVLPESMRQKLPPPGPPAHLPPPSPLPADGGGKPAPFLPGTPMPPADVLPPPKPVDPPASWNVPGPRPVEGDGPILMRGEKGEIKVQMLRPVPMPPEP